MRLTGCPPRHPVFQVLGLEDSKPPEEVSCNTGEVDNIFHPYTPAVQMPHIRNGQDKALHQES